MSPNEFPDLPDTTVNHQTGRVHGIFLVGSKIEDLKDTYDVEAKNYEAMKVAFMMSGKALEDYKHKMMQELQSAKIPVKEAEIGKVFINRCIDLIQKLFNDTEAKRLQAVGAALAIQQVVESAKRVLDEEQDKLRRFKDFSESDQHPLERPPGYPPAETKVQVKKPKKSRPRVSNDT